MKTSTKLFFIAICIIASTFSASSQNKLKTVKRSTQNTANVSLIRSSNVNSIKGKLLQNQNSSVFSLKNVSKKGINLVVDSTLKNIIIDKGTPISFTRKRIQNENVIKMSKAPALVRSVVNDFFSNTNNVLPIKNPQTQIRVKQSEIDNINVLNVRGEQIQKGISVYGTEFTLNITDSTENFMGRMLFTEKIDTISSVINSEKAIEIAKNDLSKSTKIIQFNDFQKKLFRNVSQITVDTLYYPTANNIYQYTYLVKIRPNIKDEYFIYINAVTGEIVKKYNNTKNANPTTATAVDDKGQTQTLNVLLDGTTYYMVNATETMYNATADKGMIMTFNDNYSGLTNTTIFSSTNNQWTNTGSVSAHANTKLVYNYMKNTLQRNSWDNNGGDMIIVVNLGSQENPGTPEDNAFWNGSFTAFGGNGSGSYLKNVARGLDAVGHEFGHAIVSSSADLEYQGQSGAINESYADICGAMVDRSNWKIGEDVVKTTGFPTGTMRDMANPHNGGSSLSDNGWQPAHTSEMYIGSQDNGGVHINCGITNHAYYLYATSSTKEKAEKVFYRALFNYLTKTSQFIDLRIATMKAAKDLYGDSEAVLVGQAFDKVGITETTGSTTNPTATTGELATNPGSEFMLMNRYDTNQAKYCIQYTADGTSYQSLTNAPSICRMSVTDNGKYAVLVASDNNIYEMDLSTGNISALTSNGLFAAAAISKDGKRLAAVSTQADATIYVYDLSTGQGVAFELYNPTTGTGSSQAFDVKYADAIEFDTSGEYVIYDSYNQISSLSGENISNWDIGIMRVWDLGKNTFGDGKIEKPFGVLPEGTSVGNPVFTKNSPHIFGFDYIDTQNQYGAFVANLASGDVNLLFSNNTVSYISFGIGDNLLAYNYKDTSGNTHIALVGLSTDKMSISGSAVAFADNAYYPFIYGNGTRVLGVKPQVNFTSNVTTGKVPLAVSYEDLSSSNPTTWLWEFEGGTPATSTEKYPKVTYNSTGNFKVKLTATNTFGSNVLEKTAYIQVSVTPVESVNQEILQIIPNPTSEYFSINGLNKNCSISIFDVSGKKVMEKTTEQNEKISIKSFNKGIYFVKVNENVFKLMVK